MTITTKDRGVKKYSVSVDLSVLEKLAGALGLFNPKFVKDISESLRDMKSGRIIKSRSLKHI